MDNHDVQGIYVEFKLQSASDLGERECDCEVVRFELDLGVMDGDIVVLQFAIVWGVTEWVLWAMKLEVSRLISGR